MSRPHSQDISTCRSATFEIRCSSFAFCAYGANRLLEDGGMSPPGFRSYLNDVICIPFWIPMMLSARPQVGTPVARPSPQPFTRSSFLCCFGPPFSKSYLPTTQAWAGLAVPDPNDVLCYAAGAFIASQFWHWRYRADDD